MKAHELLKPGTTFKSFHVKNGKVLWTKAWMNGDRRNIGISRTHKGKTYKRYINAHTEVVIDVH